MSRAPKGDRRERLLARIHRGTWGYADSEAADVRLTVGDLRFLLGIPRTKADPKPCAFNTSRGGSRFCDYCGFRVDYDKWPERVCRKRNRKKAK